MDLAKDARIMLELGCGTANCAINVVKPSQTIIVADYSRGMVRKAKQNIVESELDAQILPLVCDAQMLPFKEKCFDAVFSRGVLLSYVEDPSRLITECWRVLKDGGAVGLDAMNYGDRDKKMEKEGHKMRGFMKSEQKGKETFYFFNRSCIQNKRLVRERRLLKEDGRLVKLFLENRKKCVPENIFPLAVTDESNLDEETLKMDFSFVRYFEPKEVENLLHMGEFEKVSIHPMGCICNITSLQPQREHHKDLVKFIENNRDWFCKLEKALSDMLKIETAWHLFAEGTKIEGGTKS